MKHTQGPWIVAHKWEGWSGIEIRADKTTLFHVAPNGHCANHGEANARLIAAAPELLMALQDLRKELRAHVKFNVRKHFSLLTADAQAGTAIAKATGE